MKKSNITGWKSVFDFEYHQAIKQKSFLVLLIIFCAVALFAQPIMRLIKEKENGMEPVDIDTFYICDETGLSIPYDEMDLGEKMAKTKIEFVEKSWADEYSNAIEAAAEAKENIHERDLLADVIYDQESSCFVITFFKPAKTDYSKKDCEGLKDNFIEFYNNAKMTAIDVNEEQLNAISAPVECNVLFADADGKVIVEEEEEDTSIDMAGYTIMLAGLMIIMMLISTCGSQIANSILIEKSSKVIEYMMTNIRPMALIVGKMLAVLVTTLLQFALAGICYLISTVATDAFFGKAVESGTQAAAGANAEGILSVISNANPFTILLIILMWLFGILFYCLIAALCGASASKLDELAEALKVYQLLMIFGSYAGIAVCIMMLSGNGGAVLTAACIFPITLPFVGPTALLMGKISLLYPLIGLVLLIILAMGVFTFTSRVFEAMIFYNGKVLKFKDILAMAKVKKAAKEGK